MPTGVDEGVADTVTVDGHGGLVRVLLDNREEIVKQTLLEVVEDDGLGGRRRGGDTVRSAVRSTVPYTVRSTVLRGASGSVERGGLAVAARVQVAALGLAALRNRWPSSLVCV